MRSWPPDAPHPDPEAPEFAPFWAGCREHRLLVQSCDGCGHRRWPPRPGCPRCGEAAHVWIGAPTRGTLFSWTVVHRSTLPGFRDLVPYVVGVVALDATASLRMLGLVDLAPERLVIDLPLDVSFTTLSDTVCMPSWGVRGEASEAFRGHSIDDRSPLR